MSSGPPLAIEAVDVRKTFDRGMVKALDGLNLTVAAGEYVALTGPSGCGKSTFLHLLAALDRPDSGTLRVDGLDLATLDDPNRYRRERVGLVFQLHNLLPHLSALDNVEIAMLGTKKTTQQQRSRAYELLEAVDLAGFEHRRPPELSGGERQRVALARALANHPRLLLADEPTGSLDTHAVHRVLELLARLHEREQLTIVVVTHDPTVAAAADRLIQLEDGRVAEDMKTQSQPAGEGYDGAVSQRHTGGMGHVHQVVDEPITCELGRHLQRARLLEEMRSTRHDTQARLAPHLGLRFTVELEHQRVVAPDDQQRGRLDVAEPRRCEVGTTAA